MRIDGGCPYCGGSFRLNLDAVLITLKHGKAIEKFECPRCNSKIGIALATRRVSMSKKIREALAAQAAARRAIEAAAEGERERLKLDPGCTCGVHDYSAGTSPDGTYYKKYRHGRYCPTQQQKEQQS